MRMVISACKMSEGILLILISCMTACRGQTVLAVNTAIRGPACDAPFAAVIDDASSLIVTTILDLEGHMITVFKLMYISPNGFEVNFGYWIPAYGCNGYSQSKEMKLVEYASCGQTDSYISFYVNQRVMHRFKGAKFRADVTITNGKTIQSDAFPAPMIFDKVIERLDVNGIAVPLNENRILLTQIGTLVKYCVSPLENYTIQVHLNAQLLGDYENQCFQQSINMTKAFTAFLLQILVQDRSMCNRRIHRRLFISADDTFKNI